MHESRLVQVCFLASPSCTHLNGKAFQVTAYDTQPQCDQINTNYSSLAYKMRSEPQHVRGETYKRGMNIYRISEIIRFRIINLEHMIAPTVRFQLKLASPSAWTRIIEPKLKSPIQHQSPAMPATMPLASSPMHAFTSMMMASKLDHTQDVRTTAPPQSAFARGATGATFHLHRHQTTSSHHSCGAQWSHGQRSK